jgi:hypothetical protein
VGGLFCCKWPRGGYVKLGSTELAESLCGLRGVGFGWVGWLQMAHHTHTHTNTHTHVYKYIPNQSNQSNHLERPQFLQPLLRRLQAALGLGGLRLHEGYFRLERSEARLFFVYEYMLGEGVCINIILYCCVCVCVCVYIFIYIYICVCVYIYVCVSVYVCVCHMNDEEKF